MKGCKSKVMVIDHMPLARKAVVDALRGSPAVEIACVAPSFGMALRKIEASRPDVILLDLEHPDGLEREALAKIAHSVKLPIVLLTAMDARARAELVATLGIEPDMVVEKPVSNLVSGIFELVPVLESVLKRAHRSEAPQSIIRQPAIEEREPIPRKPPTQRIVAIGASTGGTEVIAELLAHLPSEMPGIVIVQHMPMGFTRKFAERLDHLSVLDVKEAEDGDDVRPGSVLVAPGGQQLRVMRRGEGYVVRVQEGARVSSHCPSVDVLLSSVARAAGPRGIGVVLTGMGKDGAAGLLEMRQAGARTFAQDEESSIVFGMPAEAGRLGAAEKIVSARDLPRHLAVAAST